MLVVGDKEIGNFTGKFLIRNADDYYIFYPLRFSYNTFY